MSTQSTKNIKTATTKNEQEIAVSIKVFGNVVSVDTLQKAINDASSMMARFEQDAASLGLGKIIRTGSADSVSVSQVDSIRKVAAKRIADLREARATGKITKQEMESSISKETSKRDLALFGNALIDSLALAGIAQRKAR